MLFQATVRKGIQGEGIREDQEGRSPKRGGRKHHPVIGTGEQADGVRHDQADESDQARERHRDAHGCARGEEGQNARAAHVHAEGGGALVAQREQIEPSREGHEHQRRHHQGERGAGEQGHRLVPESARQPEGDRLHLIGPEDRFHRKHQRGSEGVEDDAHQQRPGRLELAARAPEREDEQRGGHRSRDRRQLRGKDADERRRGAGRDAERGAGGHRHQGGADGRATGEAEDEGVGEGIAQKRLQGDAGNGKRGAHLRSQNDPGNAQPEEHRRIRLAAREGIAQ